MYDNGNIDAIVGPTHDGDYLGRQCCSLSPVHRCQTACLKAKQYSEDLATECRKSDNMQLFQCLSLIRVGFYFEFLMSSNYSCRPIVSNRRVKIVVTYQPTCSAAKRVRRFTALRRHPLPEPVSIPSCYSLYTLIGRVLNCLNQIPLSHVSRYAIFKTVATHTRARARKGLSRNIIPLHAFSVLLTKGLKFETKNDFSMEKKQESRRPV